MARLRSVPSWVLVGGAALIACPQPVAASGREVLDAAPFFAQHASYLAGLAVGYEHGEGVPRDPPRAAALYCEAA